MIIKAKTVGWTRVIDNEEHDPIYNVLIIIAVTYDLGETGFCITLCIPFHAYRILGSHLILYEITTLGHTKNV